MTTSTLPRRSRLAMAGATAGLATLLAPTAAHAAAPQQSTMDATALQPADVAALPAPATNSTTEQSRTATAPVAVRVAQAPARRVAPPNPAAPGATATAAAWYCKRVTAREVRVWKTAATTDPNNSWGVWRTGTQFWTDATDPPYNRYHTILSNGGHAWVTSDPRYVTSC
jgi:hypothetical protein